MLDFYLEVLLKKWPEAVRQLLTKWRFWFWFAPIIGAYVVPNVYWQRYLSVQDGLPRWVLPRLLIAVAVYVFLRVVYGEIEEPKRELKALKAQLASATTTERLETIKLVEALRGLQKSGLNLRKEIVKTFVPDKHKKQIKEWQASVLEVLKSEAPDYENEMLMPPPNRQPMRHATERDLALADIEEWLQKLGDVVKTIAGRQ